MPVLLNLGDTRGFLLMDEPTTTRSLRADSRLAILEALVDAVRDAAPSLRCRRRGGYAVFADHAELLVIIARTDGAQLVFDDHVVCSVGDRPAWSSGVIITHVGAEILSTLRGLVRKLHLASLERAAHPLRAARREQRASRVM